jgi:hypothetical protein
MGRAVPPGWQEFAGQVGGEVVKARFFRPDTVLIRRDPWAITLDTRIDSGGSPDFGGAATDIYTRLSARYVSGDGFQFSIRPTDEFSRLGKALGIRFELGDPDIDRRYLIKTSDEAKVRALFANPRFSELFRDRKYKLHLKVKGSNELCLEVPGRVTDPQELKALLDLFTEALAQISVA